MTRNTRATAANRKAESAVALRIAGATYEEITAALGYSSPNRCQEQMERALARSIAPEDRERQREIAGRRLERLLRGVWTKATTETHPEHLTAVRTAKDLIDRFARLYGLDEPVELIVTSPTTAEIEAWVTTIVGVAHEVPTPSPGDILGLPAGPTPNEDHSGVRAGLQELGPESSPSRP